MPRPLIRSGQICKLRCPVRCRDLLSEIRPNWDVRWKDLSDKVQPIGSYYEEIQPKGSYYVEVRLDLLEVYPKSRDIGTIETMYVIGVLYQVPSRARFIPASFPFHAVLCRVTQKSKRKWHSCKSVTLGNRKSSLAHLIHLLILRRWTTFTVCLNRLRLSSTEMTWLS